MRAVADQLPAMECPQHKLVALVGTTKTDGSASFYDVIIRVSDSVRAPHYPMPLPVIARSVEERELLTSLASVKSLFDLVERTDVSFVGVGAVGDSGALVQDGIITRQEAEALRQAGAVGEITGWAFDSAGRVLSEGTNQRVASAPLRRADNRLVIGVAMGPSRRAPMRGALAGRLISGSGHRRGDGRAFAAALKRIDKNTINLSNTWIKAASFLQRRGQIRIDFAGGYGEYSPAYLANAQCSALPHRRKHYEGSREGRAGGGCAGWLLASRLRGDDADDRDRQQRRYDPTCRS